MAPKTIVAGLGLALTLAACAGDEPASQSTGTPTASARPLVSTFPVIGGYAHGKEVNYLLQEISKSDVAQLMSEKTGLQIPVVASLANVPRKALGDLYLFMNGVSGPNPFGFQKNVIDSVPGEPGYSPLWLHTFVKWAEGTTPRELKSEEAILKGPNPFGFQRNVIDSVTGEPGYSPLWRHTFVKWTDDVTPRELKSEEEILAASQAGDVTLQASKLVINCPVIPASIQR